MGHLTEILRLNPQIKFNGRGNKIYPNMKIILPGEDVVTVAEAPAVVHDVRENDEQSTYWIVTPSLSWKNLSSTDDNIYRTSQISALSDLSYGFSLTYGMRFEENLDVYSRLALESVSFLEDSSIHLDKKDFFSSRFNVGILYDQKWELELGLNDEFFLTNPSANLVEVKKVSLPEMKISYQKDFYQIKKAKLAYTLTGTAILPRSTPGVESKLSYGGGAEIEATLKNQSFVIGYDLKLLKASGNSTDSHNIFWKFIWNAQ